MSFSPKRKSGPLGQLQSEADKLKIKVQEVTGIISKWTPKSVEVAQLEKYYSQCVDYANETISLLNRAKLLKLQNEPTLPSVFEEKKLDEIKRLQGLQQRLIQLLNKMEQLSDSDGLINKRRNELPSYFQNETKKVTVQETTPVMKDDDTENFGEYADLHIAIEDFNAEQDGDLSIKKNQVVDILKKHENGWWEAEDDDGNTGLVPSNFIRKLTDEDEEQEKTNAVSISEAEPALSSILKTSTAKTAEDNKDNVSITSQQDSKTSIQSPVDEGVETPVQSSTSIKSGKQLWKGVSSSLTETPKVTVTDVLAAMGALPAGFRTSTLYNLKQSSSDYSLRAALLPSRTNSNLAYDDLFWDSATNSVCPISTPVLRTCNIWKCTQIPLPGTGVEVLSRHIRLALFDGSKVLSNVETIRAYVQPNRPKLWQFSSPKTKDGGIVPTLLHGNSTIRTNTVHNNLGILFELAVTYIRNPPKRVVRFSDGVTCEYSDDDDDGDGNTRTHLRQTGERDELSCGWFHLKLFDETGNKIPNKTYEVFLVGGTPFERGIDVDPSIARRAKANPLRAMMAANKEPRLFVQIGEPSQSDRKYLDFLPTTIVFPTPYGHLLAIFRLILLDSLVCDRKEVSDASLIHSPVIATFLDAVNQPDIMDAVRKDLGFLAKVFKSTVMEIAYPLLHTKTLPKEKWAEHQIEAARSKFIAQLALNAKGENGVANYFLTSNPDMEPFDIREITFDPLRNIGRVL